MKWLSLAVLALVGCSKPSAPKKTVVVDVYTDVVCPWCYLGTERLDRVVASIPEMAVTYRHHAFFLNPDVPEAGVELAPMLEQKTGRKASEMFAVVERAAHESNVPLELAKQPKTYPTILAHTVIRFAAAHGKAREAERAIMHAYFLDAQNIADRTVLATLCQQIGLDREALTKALADPQQIQLTHDEAQASVAAGVHSVPQFVFAGGQRLSGARSEEELRAALLASAPQ